MLLKSVVNGAVLSTYALSMIGGIVYPACGIGMGFYLNDLSNAMPLQGIAQQPGPILSLQNISPRAASLIKDAYGRPR